MTETSLTPLSSALKSGLRLKCPRCGEGKIFRAYLKQHDECPHCGESFEGISPDDGPAWLTILIVGHIMATVILHMEYNGYATLGMEMTVAAVGTAVLALIILPFSKGLFVAMLWHLREKRKAEQ